MDNELEIKVRMLQERVEELEQERDDLRIIIDNEQAQNSADFEAVQGECDELLMENERLKCELETEKGVVRLERMRSQILGQARSPITPEVQIVSKEMFKALAGESETTGLLACSACGEEIPPPSLYHKSLCDPKPLCLACWQKLPSVNARFNRNVDEVGDCDECTYLNVVCTPGSEIKGERDRLRDALKAAKELCQCMHDTSHALPIDYRKRAIRVLEIARKALAGESETTDAIACYATPEEARASHDKTMPSSVVICPQCGGYGSVVSMTYEEIPITSLTREAIDEAGVRWTSTRHTCEECGYDSGEMLKALAGGPTTATKNQRRPSPSAIEEEQRNALVAQEDDGL